MWHAATPTWPPPSHGHQYPPENRFPAFSPFPAPIAALYVGDLDPGVTELDLVHALRCAGVNTVASVRVCRDRFSGSSLRYAYLNFHFFPHAAAALKVMNHRPLNGKPMRVMWSTRDPSARRSGVGNLFVKNLEPWMGGADLEVLFSNYGRVDSCKVATDDKGNKKLFGFVQMESEAAAKLAIESLHGVILPNSMKRLYVSWFVKRSKRQTPTEVPASSEEQSASTLYIKNLDMSITDDALREMFSKHGSITSAVVVKDKYKRSRNFGFVKFKSPQHAEKALVAMNGSMFGSKPVHVRWAHKRSDHQLTKRYDQQTTQIQGSTVYVNHLEESIDANSLLGHFTRYGNILWARVIYDRNGHSRGFGFVCFSSADEANKAVAEVNGTLYQGMCLNVSIAWPIKDSPSNAV